MAMQFRSMDSTSPRARLASWLSGRTRSYGRVVVALCLNVPLLIAALSRYPDGLSWLSFGGVYTALVFVGYYILILLALLTVLFLVVGAWAPLFVGAGGGLIGLALYYFLVDGVVYRMLRMHIDAFWLRYLFTTFEGLGVTGGQVVGAVALLALVLALEWWILRLAARVRSWKRWALALTIASVLAFVVSQVLHIAAYEANDTRITAITPQLPFYYPVTSHRNAVKYAGLLERIGEPDRAPGDGAPESFRYPLRELRCPPAPEGRPMNVLLLLLESWRADALSPEVAPQMHDFSGRSSIFLKHFSTGNSTPAGVFPLFYGIHSTYWAAVKANNALIRNPPLIDVLQDHGYAFGIYADSHFERHKIKDTVFRGITVHEQFDGEAVHEQDRDLTDRLFEFMADRQQTGTPFFGFAFYKSTHYPYSYPEPGPFQPTRELNVFLADAADDPTPVVNDYLNSVHYVDELIGHLLRRMEAIGLLDNTMVIITSDHGEEFNDNGRNYWGHTGNFTAYQSRVPLIVYLPTEQPRRVTAVTSGVDIPPTILEAGLGCPADADAHSNGLNLFAPLDDVRPVVVSSYVNHALIVDDDVFVVWPMYVQRYKLDNLGAEAGWPDPVHLQRALREMARFYGGARSEVGSTWPESAGYPSRSIASGSAGQKPTGGAVRPAR